MANERKIVDSLGKLTALEAEQLSKLGKLLEEKWGVAASAAVSMAAVPAKAAAAVAAAAENAVFTVVLASTGNETTGSAQKARFWYRAEPIPAFGGRTAEALVNEGKAADVRDFLDHIAVGGFA